MLGRVAKPLETVGENRDGRFAHRGAFQRESVVADHHLVQGETFLVAADEDVAPQFGDRDHNPGLTYHPGVRWSVIHDPDTPGYFARETWKASSQKESEVAKSLGREHLDLLFARSILRVGCRVDQKPHAGLDSEVRPLVFVPASHPSRRMTDIVIHLTCINGVV